MRDTLVDMTIKRLIEGFRDTDKMIDAVSSEMYDILYKYDYSGECLTHLDDIVLNYDEMDISDVTEFDKLQKKLIALETQRESEYNKEISDLPHETNKTNFDGFDITKTDPGFDEYFIKGNKNREYELRRGGYMDAYIAEMTPEEYLKLCGKYAWKQVYNNIDDIIKYTPDKQLVDEYVDMFKKGMKAPMPVLDLNHNSQEGRHRALACIKVGIKTMPVLIKI